MEYLNAAWNAFSTHNIQKDVMVQVSSNFLHDVEQSKTELATLGQEVRNFRVELHEHRFIDKEGNFTARALNQKENQKLVRFCNYCLKNGHTPKWCRKKMRDEETQKKYEMPSRRNHVLTQNHDTKAVDRSAQYDQNLDQSPDSEDGNNPTLEHQPTEEKTGHGESNEITPPERRSFSRNSGMNFNVAQVTSAVESDNELSDSLPLDYCSLWKTLLGFFSYLILLCLLIFLTVIWWCFCWRLRPIRLLIIASKPPSLCRDTKPSTKIVAQFFLESLTWTSKFSDTMPWPHQESTKQNLRCKWIAKNLQCEHTFMTN